MMNNISPLEQEKLKEQARTYRINFVTKYKRVKRMSPEDRLRFVVKAFEKYPDFFTASIEQDENLRVVAIRPANEQVQKIFNAYTCGNLYGIKLYDNEETDENGYGLFIPQADCDIDFADYYFMPLFNMPIGDGSERLGWGYADITTRTISSYVDLLYHELMFNGDNIVTN